jgi:hypothetical protein
VPQSFTTVYDVRAAGGIPIVSAEEVQGWLFGLAFASIVLLVAVSFTWARNKNRLFVIPVLAVFVFCDFGLDAWDRYATARALAVGKLNVVEGCVSNFETNRGEFYSIKSSRPDEQWDVGDRHFSYKVTSNAPGYHVREVRGGVVHKGEYVRVRYLVSPVFHRQEIMEMEVGSERCS